MSNLKETMIVRCPIHEVMPLVERYFAERHRGQEPGTFTLGIDLADAGLPGHVRTSHDVKIAYRADKEAAGIALAWDPNDTMMPKFSGALHVERHDIDLSALTLEGRYDPPLGLVGKTFDALLGKKIAAATATAFLRDVKAFVESGYQRALETTLSSSPKE